MALNHSKIVDFSIAHSKHQAKGNQHIREVKPNKKVSMDTYVVCIYGSLNTSSEKLYLIFLYTSSPTDEKSRDMSAGGGMSLPTSNIMFLVS